MPTKSGGNKNLPIKEAHTTKEDGKLLKYKKKEKEWWKGDKETNDRPRRMEAFLRNPEAAGLREWRRIIWYMTFKVLNKTAI